MARKRSDSFGGKIVKQKRGPKPSGDPVVPVGIALRPEIVKILDEVCKRMCIGRSQAITRMIQLAADCELSGPTMKPKTTE